MTHLIPPVPSSVSVTTSQTIQPVALITTAIETINVLQSDSTNLLSTEPDITNLESSADSVFEKCESNFVVKDLVNVNANEFGVIPTNEFVAEKIVDSIISKKENRNENINTDEITNSLSDDSIAKNAENNVTKNAVENISSNAGVDIGIKSRSNLRRELLRMNKFHRIAAVRLEHGVSLESAAKRLRIDIAEAKEQENELTDLKLSQLYQWRNVLEVSAGELVLEPDEIPANPIRNRCQLVRLMKTVRSIIIEAKSEVVLILARQLESQLIELMPELATIAAWPSIGQSRDHHSPGTAATRCAGFANVYIRRNANIKSENQ
ncbi:MAG: hypothetical protein LBE18_08740 [Planctomycetaceae bacterium]|jgi:transcriptional regulator with XRE-family HTH domain|nr:hypothetical protein [Planctomycetaceae bacterium]